MENGTRILLGGLVERRESMRGESNRQALVEMAKRKFAESPDDDFKVVLLEEE